MLNTTDTVNPDDYATTAELPVPAEDWDWYLEMTYVDPAERTL